MMIPRFPVRAPEWLEADGLGGFASGTVMGTRTRRYHGLLTAALHPPTDRVVLVNAVEAWLETEEGSVALSSHHYAPDIVYPDGAERVHSFTADPWPTWVYRLPDGTEITHEIFVTHGSPRVALSWRIVAGSGGGGKRHLVVRPLLSGRDLHSVHLQNPAFSFEPEEDGEVVGFNPYHGLPGVRAVSNGRFDADPQWYRSFLYIEERSSEAECMEDLASPGYFRWDLSRGEAVLVLGTDHDEDGASVAAAALMTSLREREIRRRAQFARRVERSSDAFVVEGTEGVTMLSGYPWLEDRARDVFICLRSFIRTGELALAGRMLRTWTKRLSGGMLPRNLRERAYDSVDASLWMAVAIGEYLEACASRGRAVPEPERRSLGEAVEEVVVSYRAGTRCGIRVDSDGLLACGASGTALTWMDRAIGDWVVTPRIGKPVEIQALWMNTLEVASRFVPSFSQDLERARIAFLRRFWCEEEGWLYDVVDMDHQPGKVDSSCRPNQIFAVGGLPLQVVRGLHAARVLAAVERRLWTPAGLRTLDPQAPGYAPRYEGGVRQRDGCAHQGTVWPWLMEPFVDAWLRIRGESPAVRAEACARFLVPLERRLGLCGYDHLAELADADAPHTPRGAPFHGPAMAALLSLQRRLAPGGRGTPLRLPSDRGFRAPPRRGGAGRGLAHVPAAPAPPVTSLVQPRDR
jgi:predicted glycogen debranching enzyme